MKTMKLFLPFAFLCSLAFGQSANPTLYTTAVTKTTATNNLVAPFVIPPGMTIQNNGIINGGTISPSGGGNFLQSANNLSDVQSVTTSRTNLGLGAAATQTNSFFLQSANNLSDLGTASTARTNLGLGTAAVKAASSNQTNLAAVSGSISSGNVPEFSDTSGTIEDSGVAVSALTTVTSGTWTPTLNSFTIVNGTGGITEAGHYVQIGKLVWATCVISGTGTATIASSGDSGNITGIQSIFTPGQSAAGRAVSAGGSTAGFDLFINTAISTAIFNSGFTTYTPSSSGPLILTIVYSQ